MQAQLVHNLETFTISPELVDEPSSLELLSQRSCENSSSPQWPQPVHPPFDLPYSCRLSLPANVEP